MRKCIQNIFARSLSAVMALSFLLPPQALSKNISSQAPHSWKRQVFEEAAKPAMVGLKANPYFEEFMALPTPEAAPYFKIDDPILDRDPYFARAQAWLAPSNDSEEISWEKDNSGHLIINLSDGLGSFLLKQRLSPILDTDSFILLSADSDSQIFESKALANETPGEGFFFIDKVELLKSSEAESPVYVYFMPLGGSGWKGISEADSVGAELIFLESLEGRAELVQESDLAGIRDQSRMNALMGSYLAAQDYGRQALEKAQSGKLGFLYPAAGSTYAFGLAFSGFNQDNPQNSLDPKDIKVSQLEGFLNNIKEYALPTAHAVSPEVFTEVSKKLFTFAKIMGVVAVVGFVAKNVFPSKNPLYEKIKDVRSFKNAEALKRVKRSRKELEEARAKMADEIPKTWLGLAWQDFNLNYMYSKHSKKLNKKEERIKRMQKSEDLPFYSLKSDMTLTDRIVREFIESNDVMAHTLWSNFQMPATIMSTYGIEYPIDRMLPEAGSAENSLVRRMLNASFFKVRAWSTAGRVNARALALAGILMGAISTSFSYWQLTMVIPWILSELSPHLWDGAQERIDDKILGVDQNTTDFIVAQLYRSVYGWVMGGAPSFFIESRSQIELFVKGEVEKQMRKEGTDPHDPLNKDEFNKRLARIVDKNLSLLGLPSSKEFLFDAVSIEKNSLRNLGYNGDPTRKISDENRLFYLGEHRVGLVKSSLPRAVKKAALELERYGSDDTSAVRKKALKILEDIRATLKEAQPEGIFFQGKDATPSDQKKAKMLLTSLTYLGPPGHKLEERVPLEWVNKYGKEAAIQAAYLYRKTFMSLLYGNKDYKEIAEETLTKHRTAALNAVQAIPGVENFSPIEKSRAFESAIFSLTAREAVEEKNRKFKAYSKDPIEKMQIKKALLQTQRRVSQEAKKDKELGKDKTERFQKIYAEELAQAVGIKWLDAENEENPDVAKLYNKCHERAAYTTHNEIAHNEAISNYISNLKNETEKKEYIAHLYAKAFIHSYKEMAIDTLRVDQNTEIKPHSPVTPGVTMKIRQTNLVRKSKMLTGMVRFWDSLFGAEVGYDTGSKALLYRTVPGSYDIISSLKRTAIFWPTLLLFRYPYYHVWGIHYPIETYMLVASFNFLMMAPVQWLKRLSQQNGLKPIQSVKHAALHVTLGSWTTFISQIPVMLLAPGKGDASPELFIDNPDSSANENLASVDQSAGTPNTTGPNQCDTHLR